jgi:hypothetical protein
MRLLLAATLLLLPALAAADDKATPAPVPAQGNTDDCARARKLNKVCELTIGEEEIEGGVTKPDGIGFSARDWAYMNSLIHIRRDFIPEIIKSAEDL